jgi:hypothetical protein
MHAEIHYMNIGIKPNFDNTLKRKECFTQSKAFIISNLIIMSFSLFFHTRMDGLLQKKYIVNDMSILHESSLIIWYYLRHKGYQQGFYYLGHVFIWSVAKGNGVESRKGGGTNFFRNGGEKGGVGVLSNLRQLIDVLNHSKLITFYDEPRLL